MNKILLAHPGTQYAPKLAAELNDRGILFRYWTGFSYGGDGVTSAIAGFLPTKLSRLLSNRKIPRLPSKLIRTRPLVEVVAACRCRKGWTTEAALHQRNRSFQLQIPDRELAAASLVVGFDTSSWILAERCNAIGVPFVLDQSIAHPKAKEIVYQKLLERYPAWKEEIQVKSQDLIDIEAQEHHLARNIVVASTFTKKSLVSNGVDDSKIRVIPYGVDLKSFTPSEGVSDDDRRFRFLFVGAVCARKGIPILLEAWKRLGAMNAELWLVGPITDEARKNIPELPGLKIFGRLPHTELPAIFSQCDVFVFPSFFEGFGLVILEALACGLQVITTEATAGPDVFESDATGIVTESGDTDALVRAMENTWKQRSLRELSSRLCRENARRLSWALYGERWHAFAESLDSTAQTNV